MHTIKKRKSGFKLIELLVVLTIVAIIGSMFLFWLPGCHREGIDPAWYNPEMVRAQSQRQQAEEMARANDLKERELKLLEQKK